MAVGTEKETCMSSDLFERFFNLSFKISSNEDDWIYDEEPHCSRRKEILRKHPEIKKLMGCNPKITFIVVPEVLVQILACWYLKEASWLTIFISAYIFGGVINHSLGSAIHEIGHNLAFGHRRPRANRVLSIFCNLPLGIPMALSYKKYHSDHHRYLGEEFMDVDIPTRFESYMFRKPITKIIWLILHPIIHAIRPFYKSPKPLNEWEMMNGLIQILFDVVIYQQFGFKSITYLILGTFMAIGFHPLAGHFISEHYLFSEGVVGKHQATHSYYGPLNIVLFNVGYHVEHHDFPYIPYNKIAKVSEIAPEFYENLPYHTSLLKVLWDFIFDENVGPHSRGVGYLKYKDFKSS
ncbi:sphingolipid delta(4)-desaturase DES1 [Octopus bimaculoides]|uniref:sphingolipid 4-desaturase n=1 Tax=Octopus bimaculoides TaxID=37653 RepID=A0A0L8GPA1_OCTBM|nr:sphingolipid delta(4)-desaturase DES1 [Octopus bimaculoides]|eukprot:XP_014779225.1 PREDICTED: sphingolipid delta(4)-desaturase/C4-monooxygenase DES2-like [Octopus bimaculoides]